MSDKDKCEMLKDVRKKLADELGVEIIQEECTYEGDDCEETCPACKEEEKVLNDVLLKAGEIKHEDDLMVEPEKGVRRGSVRPPWTLPEDFMGKIVPMHVREKEPKELRGRIDMSQLIDKEEDEEEWSLTGNIISVLTEKEDE